MTATSRTSSRCRTKSRRAVVDALKIQLLSSRSITSRHQTDNTEAYSQYLLGNQLRDRDSPESNEQARTAYQKAIALDPHYAAAYSGLADAEWRLADMRTNNPADYTRASEAAEKAIALDPNAPEGYWARGQLRNVYYYDWSGAKMDYDKALSLDPAFGRAGVDRAGLLATLGNVPEAIEALRQIIARDPLSGPAWRRLVTLLMDNGRFSEVPEAISRIRAIAATTTQIFQLPNGVAQWSISAGARRLSVAEICGVASAGSRDGGRSLGHPEKSQRALEEAMRQTNGDSLSYQYAMVYAGGTTRMRPLVHSSAPSRCMTLA